MFRFKCGKVQFEAKVTKDDPGVAEPPVLDPHAVFCPVSPDIRENSEQPWVKNLPMYRVENEMV